MKQTSAKPSKKESPKQAKPSEKKETEASALDKVFGRNQKQPQSKSETRRLESLSKEGTSKSLPTEKDSGLKSPTKQTRMRDDGEIEDDDSEEEDKPLTSSQAKLSAELAGIVLRQGQRVFALKLNSSVMIRDLTRIWNEQRSFNMGFKIPVEKRNGEVTKWKTVEFPTKLIDLSLKGKDSATCHGHIDHAGAVAMSELILNWKGGVEFLLDGVQQSMF